MQNRMWGQSFIIFLCHWMFLLGNGVIWKSLHLSTAVFVCVCVFVCVSVSAMSCFHTLPLFFWTSPSGAVCQKANVQISNQTLNRLFAASSLAKIVISDWYRVGNRPQKSQGACWYHYMFCLLHTLATSHSSPWWGKIVLILESKSNQILFYFI